MIVNSSIFPCPLSYEEEQKYIQAMIYEKDIEARNKLIEHNLRLVAHIVKKYYSSPRDFEDLMSIGTIGLIKAIDTLNFDKVTRLATYASRCIDNEVLIYLRKKKQLQRDISLNDPITLENGDILTLGDILCQTMIDEIDDKLEYESITVKFYTLLSVMERKVIENYFGLFGLEKMTQREISNILGVSQSKISRIKKEALKKLKLKEW